MTVHFFNKAVRRRVEPFLFEGTTLYRAHVWNQEGAYSSKTFASSGEAMSWIPTMKGKS